MGIKDWFGGDRKKAAYEEQLKEAVSDGKLSPEDLAKLRALRDELKVDEVSADKTQKRRAFYAEAVQGARMQGDMTRTGVHELAKIQKFLALRDDQIVEEKRDVHRLRTITDIRKGHLPLVQPNNIALRNLPLEPGEVPHYTMSVEVFTQPSTRQADGVAIQWGVPYECGSAAPHALPEGGARKVGESVLVLTSNRLILRSGTKVGGIRLARDAQIFLYNDGIRLAHTVGNTLLKFRSGSDDTSDLVGELLSAVMRPQT